MPEIMKIGSFMIQTKLLILIVSIIFSYYVVRWKLGRLQTPPEITRTILDKFINAIILAVLIWKFAPLLQEPALLWTRPLSLLAYTGGTLGLIVGIASGLSYAIIALWRARLLIPIALDALASGVLIAWSLYRVTFWEYGTLTDMPWGITLTDPMYRYHPLNLYAGIVGVIVMLYMWFARSHRWGTAKIARDIYTGLGLGWFVVTLFQRGEVSFLLSTEQWLLLAMIAIGSMMPYIARLMQQAPSAVDASVDHQSHAELSERTNVGLTDAVAATDERVEKVSSNASGGDQHVAGQKEASDGQCDMDLPVSTAATDERTNTGVIQSSSDEHTNDGKEMMEVVKETSMNSSPEQRQQSKDNRTEAREFKPTQAVDKKLDGPNRPAE